MLSELLKLELTIDVVKSPANIESIYFNLKINKEIKKRFNKCAMQKTSNILEF